VEKIAVIGGTGAEGTGLALRFAKAGLQVLIGSRNLAKAEASARQVMALTGSEQVTGRINADAAASAPVVILTVPLSAQVETLKSIRDSLASGSILVDTTVPLEVAIGGRVSRLVTLWDGSAAQQAARLAPVGIAVVAAFHSLSAESLGKLDQAVDSDVLICGDSAEAKGIVQKLAEIIPGVCGIDAGPLDNARLLESSAAMLIALNLRHKVKHSGLRITGLPHHSGVGK
jgi:NADPH-dependent F420 reductase